MRPIVALAFVAAFSSANTSYGQELLKPGGRQGYYLGGGFRQGFLTMDADKIGNLGVMLGGGFAIRAGQVVNDLFGFGLTISSGGGSTSEWTGGYGALQLEAQLTPIPGEDFAIRGAIGFGGLGVGRKEAADETKDDPTGTAGALYTLGVSYELFPFYEAEKYETGGFAFTGFLEAAFLPGDNLVVGGILIGLEVTYWFGFQQSRLELPPEAAFKKD